VEKSITISHNTFHKYILFSQDSANCKHGFRLNAFIWVLDSMLSSGFRTQCFHLGFRTKCFQLGFGLNAFYLGFGLNAFGSVNTRYQHTPVTCTKSSYNSLHHTHIGNPSKFSPPPFLDLSYLLLQILTAYTDKKEKKIFLIYKEIQSGEVA
jgi:hypothetical protein